MKASKKSPAPLGTLVIAGETPDQDIVLQLNILEETNLSIDTDIRKGKKDLEDLKALLRKIGPIDSSYPPKKR